MESGAGNPGLILLSVGAYVASRAAIGEKKALYELERTQKRDALVTMCIGGGQVIAAIFERH